MFKAWLQEQQYRESTIKEHLQNIKRFKHWCEAQNTHADKVSYNQLLQYVQDAQKRGLKKASINIALNSIGKYYEYLVNTEQRKDNPAKGLRLKDSHKKVLQDVLTAQELEETYMCYQNRKAWTFKGKESKAAHKRNIVILGLLIYAGLQIPELRKMEKGYLDLLQGTVYVPSTSRGNSRILKLHVRQVVPMQEYLQSIPQGQGQLFSCNIRAVMSWLIGTLKKQSRKIKSGQQIRSSVIMNWLKCYNIRQVQYMAGHKHIGSTEKYKQEDLEDLQRQLEKFHPMK